MNRNKTGLLTALAMTLAVSLSGCLDEASNAIDNLKDTADQKSTDANKKGIKQAEEIIADMKNRCSCPSGADFCVLAETACPQECTYTPNSSFCK